MSAFETVGFVRQEFTKRPFTSLGNLYYSSDDWDSFTETTDAEDSAYSLAECTTAGMAKLKEIPANYAPSSLSEDGELEYSDLGSSELWSVPGTWTPDILGRHYIGASTEAIYQVNQDASFQPCTAVWMVDHMRIEGPAARGYDWSAVSLIRSLPEIVARHDDYTAQVSAIEYFSVIADALLQRGFERTTPYRDVFGSWIADYFRVEERITCAVSPDRIQLLSYLNESIEDKRFDREPASKHRLIGYLEDLLGGRE